MIPGGNEELIKQLEFGMCLPSSQATLCFCSLARGRFTETLLAFKLGGIFCVQFNNGLTFPG